MSKSIDKIILHNEPIEGFVDDENGWKKFQEKYNTNKIEKVELDVHPNVIVHNGVEGFVVDENTGEIIDGQVNSENTDNLTPQQTPEQKRAKILTDYNLTEEQFTILCAIVLAEAKANSYEDAYAVINTIYNRCHSKAWIYDGERIMGQGNGKNLYYHAIMPGQFVVYGEGKYKQYLGNTSNVGYTAILDFLTSEKPMHNYTEFKSSNSYPRNSEQFVEGGNKYHNPIKENDRVE